MSLHIAPVVLHLRFFDDAIDVDKPLCEMTEPYYCHTVAVIDDTGTARLQGLSDHFKRKDFNAVFKQLKKHGVIKVEWKHNGREKHKYI